MKIYLGLPRGFCAGVVRAIDVVSLALDRYGPPIYVKHQVVHNPYVVESLETKGAVTVECISEIPVGSTVVFSAHGSPPSDFVDAKSRNLRVIDATCPLVTKVHNEAHKYSNDGRKLILIGHRGHQEVKGSMGQQPMYLVDDREEFELPEWESDIPITVLTQTTLSVDDTDNAVEQIKSRFSNVLVRNDLCYATTNRQAAVKKLCEFVELILVIGSSNSSNCNRLKEVAESQGVIAYLINGPRELNKEWFKGIENVGITSGASTPDELVDSVVVEIGADEVTVIDGVEEDVNFVLPSEIR